jgi:L-seryl-tRNA(Ser) seleniumtransferase
VSSLRRLPSVDRLLRDERLAGCPRELAVAAARAALEEARDAIRAGGEPGDLVERALATLEAARAPSLRRVLNATGVIVHTNLGRAPLPAAALERVAAVGRGYSNLELELAGGKRGSRQDHLGALLRRLTGAEAGLVVNNNAAAVLLAVAALAEGREVIVSRGELVEIGDGFRIPEVLARSGARLIEVGTTNRTRAGDYEEAIGPETALLLRVHQSNYRIVGFTAQPSVGELAEVARRAGLALVDDLGSGALPDLEGEPAVAASLRAGADLVCFSGDKLLGGPQAGVVAGRADLVGRLRRHPLQRALRADKLSLAALEGTLALYLDPELAFREIPVLRMLREQPETVRARAERLAAAVGGEVEETAARVGGGAMPLAELPSFACAVEEELAEGLRAGEPPVIGVLRDGRTLLDCRTLTDAEADEVAAAIGRARGR